MNPPLQTKIQRTPTRDLVRPQDTSCNRVDGFSILYQLGGVDAEKDALLMLREYIYKAIYCTFFLDLCSMKLT